MYGSKQYDECISIRKTVFVEEQNVSWSLELEHEEESIHFLGFYLQAGLRTPVCTGRLRVTGNILKFERIATLIEHRGKGLGRELMQSLQSYAQEHFSNLSWQMGAQISAFGFYESLGWIKLNDEVFLDADIEHYTLTYPKI